MPHLRPGYLAILAAGLSWGSSFSLVRLATTHDSLGAYLLLFGCGGISISLLVGWIWKLDMHIQWSKSLLALLVVGGLIIPLCLGLGERNAPSYLAGMIIAVVPAGTVIAAHWFFGDRSSRTQLLGAPLALVGLAVLLYNTTGQIAAPLAIVLLGLAAASMIASNLLLRQLATTPVHQTAFVTMLGTTLAGGLLCLFIPFQITPTAILPALGAGVVIALGGLFFFLAIHSIGITRAIAADYIAPLVAALIGLLLLHEAFQNSFFVAAGLILAGVVLVGYHPRSHTPPPAALI